MIWVCLLCFTWNSINGILQRLSQTISLLYRLSNQEWMSSWCCRSYNWKYSVVDQLIGKYTDGDKVVFQFSSVALLCPTLCKPMDLSSPGLPVHHQLPQFIQTDVYWVGDAIQPSHPLLAPSPPTFNLSQHQGLFQQISSSCQVARVLEFQLQHQFFQWIFRTDFL